MNYSTINEKPCIVPAKQGFSVSYKERFLYSKYNPSKLIIDKVSELSILPGTIFLCNSAILEYGIKELCNKLPENCLILLCEFNKDLHNLMEQTYSQIKNDIKNAEIAIPTFEELFLLPNIIQKSNYLFKCGYTFKSLGYYKRFVRIDFSAGTFFNENLYNELENACINSIKTFWSNRVTLVKFGRKYSYNLFKNLKKIESTIKIEQYFNKIEKPIIVFGAGQTLEKDIQTIKSNRELFYILCADTALQPLQKHKITPDGVFIEEVPDRSVYYHSQTPQSFNLRLLTDTLAELSREEKEKLTDACMIFAMRGKKVFIVKGSPYNIKITWPQDLAIAEKLLEADKI